MLTYLTTKTDPNNIRTVKGHRRVDGVRSAPDHMPHAAVSLHFDGDPRDAWYYYDRAGRSLTDMRPQVELIEPYFKAGQHFRYEGYIAASTIYGQEGVITDVTPTALYATFNDGLSSTTVDPDKVYLLPESPKVLKVTFEPKTPGHLLDWTKPVRTKFTHRNVFVNSTEYYTPHVEAGIVIAQIEYGDGTFSTPYQFFNDGTPVDDQLDFDLENVPPDPIDRKTIDTAIELRPSGALAFTTGDDGFPVRVILRDGKIAGVVPR